MEAHYKSLCRKALIETQERKEPTNTVTELQCTSHNCGHAEGHASLKAYGKQSGQIAIE